MMKKIITLLMCLICCCSYAFVYEGNGGKWLSEDIAVGKQVEPFDPNNHQIYFMDSDGITPVQYTQSVADGKNFGVTSIKPNPRTGYTFTGWVDVLDNPVTVLTNITADVTLKADWQINQWTLTLHDDSPSPRIYTYAWNTNVTQYVPTTRTGHSVATWSPSLPSKMPDNNFETTAVYTPNSHTITTKDGTTTLATYNTYYGQPIAELNIPSPTPPSGKIFVGWNPALPETMGDTNLTVSAVFEPYTVTITYNHPDGTFYTQQTYSAGTNITEPTEPIYDNDYFWDWSNLPDEAVATLTTTAQVFAKTNTVYGLEANLDATASDTAYTYIYDAVGKQPVRIQPDKSYNNWQTGQENGWRDLVEQYVRPCMLKADGSVDYYLDPDDQTYKYRSDLSAERELSDITDVNYTGYAMVEFKKMWSNARRIRGANKYRIIITPQEIPDITFAEAFKRSDGTFADKAYMSMFVPSLFGSAVKSIAYDSIDQTPNLSSIRSKVRSIGSGWDVQYAALTQHAYKLIFLISKTVEPTGALWHSKGVRKTYSGNFNPVSKNSSTYQCGAFFNDYSEYVGSTNNAVSKTLWMSEFFGFKGWYQIGLATNQQRCKMAYPPFEEPDTFNNYFSIADYSSDNVYMGTLSLTYFTRLGFYKGIAYPYKFSATRLSTNVLGKDSGAFVIASAQRKDSTYNAYYFPPYYGFPANAEQNTDISSFDGVVSAYYVHCGHTSSTTLPQLRGFSYRLSYIQPPESASSAPPRLMMSAPRYQQNSEPETTETPETLATPTSDIGE